MLSYKKIQNDLIKNNPEVRSVTEEEKRGLQRCILDMSVDIDRVCRKNGLSLFLTGGSALGAVRHGGFIPWDDDIDFGMSRKDYRELCRIFKKELSDRYILRCPNSAYPANARYMQIYKKGTVLKTAFSNSRIHPEMIYIDVFPYDYAPNGKLSQLVKGFRSNVLMAIASWVTEYNYRTEEAESLMKQSVEGCILVAIQNTVGKIFSFRSPRRWFDLVDRCIACSRATDYVTSATGRRHYLKEMYPSEVFFPLREITFENARFYIPGRVEDYLKGNYGDNYMRIPDEKDRESHFIKELVLPEEYM